MQNPYISFNGLAFKTPGDDDESAANTEKAMGDLKEYVLGRGSQSQAELALDYLEWKYSKVKIFTNEIRSAFGYDDFIDSEIKTAIVRKAYNGIVRRLNG